MPRTNSFNEPPLIEAEASDYDSPMLDSAESYPSEYAEAEKKGAEAVPVFKGLDPESILPSMFLSRVNSKDSCNK